MIITRKVLIFILAFVFLCSLASAANLQVGSTAKYKTIQSAVTASHDGDTINVAYGIYKENVKINKVLTMQGTGYPKVYGMYYEGGGGSINGFNFQKYGIRAVYSGSVKLIRNNYFYNCGVLLIGDIPSRGTIMNNQIVGGTIRLNDLREETVSGNTISNSVCGLCLDDFSSTVTVKNNIFKNNKYAVWFYQDNPHEPGKLTTFTGNKYSGNKVNFGWGSVVQPS